MLILGNSKLCPGNSSQDINMVKEFLNHNLVDNGRFNGKNFAGGDL
jgi:hypothetical protein